MVRISVLTGVYLLTLFLFCAGGCVAQETSSEITSTGTITYINLEGGFYGLVTSDGVNYLPLDLPDEYKQNGLKVDFTGVPDQDIMTIQMWGQPLRILSINKQNGFVTSDIWYDGEEGISPEQEMELTTLLLKSSAALSKTLNDYNLRISANAAEMKGKNLQNEDIKTYLEKVYQEIPAIFCVSHLDRTGTITAIYPDVYNDSIGVNVRDQPLVDSIVQDPVPGMSELIECIEGEDVIDIIYPLYSSSLSVTGYLSVLINPSLLVENTLDSLTQGLEQRIIVIQPDGTIIGYSGELPGTFIDESTAQIIPGIGSLPVGSYQAGRDMFSPDESVSSGMEQYLVYWSTISLHGTPWRVLVF